MLPKLERYTMAAILAASRDIVRPCTYTNIRIAVARAEMDEAGFFFHVRLQVTARQ